MILPNWRWLLVGVPMLLVASLLVTANFLPWFATIVGVLVGLAAYHYLFVAQARKESAYQVERAERRAAYLAGR